VTISTSGVPPRLKSTSDAVAPWDPALGAATCSVLRRPPRGEPRDADLGDAIRPRQPDEAVDAEGLVVLGDLVALRIVRVEVVLAVEDGVLCDLAAEPEAKPDRPLDRLPVRHCSVPDARGRSDSVRVFRGVERPDRATAEHLRPRFQLDMGSRGR